MKPSKVDVQSMLDAYIECALWTSTHEGDESGGVPLDENYDREDIAPNTHARMREDVKSFAEEHVKEIGGEWIRAGHDFWLTRNGHGAGFWYGDWPEKIGETLTKASKVYGSAYLYVGDDGKVHGHD